MKRKNFKGVSLIELLVVIGIFSIIAILSARGVLLSLRGSRKSESLGKVRENMDFSLAVIERNLRNADSVSCPSSTRVDYTDKEASPVYFSCENVGVGGYVSSASARLTSSEVDVTACQIVCDLGDGSLPPSVTISVEGTESSSSGVEAAKVTLSTKVFLRTY